MLYLSWPITVAALLLVPVFLLPARRVGAPAAAPDPRAMQLNAELGSRMTERFNVAGRPAGQAVRPPRRRGRASSHAGPAGSATSASASR